MAIKEVDNEVEIKFHKVFLPPIMCEGAVIFRSLVKFTFLVYRCTLQTKQQPE